MKAKRRIAWLLSFLMVFSLIMENSKMQVFAAGGAGETATFVIRESNGQMGTVQYKLNESGDFTTANNNTPVSLEGVTSITIKAIPTGEAKVNQNNSGITGTEQPATFEYAELISESGWTYNIQENDGNITFTIEFDNYDGTGGNAASYSVDFGTGSWKVGDVTVTADKSGEQTLSESDIITLTGFDAETMEARVDAEDGFGTTLAVTDGQTSISAHTSDGVGPTNIAFSVVEKSSEPGGGENPGENAASYSVDFGTGSWIVGDVTVTADKSGEQTLSESDIITLTGFDAETMEARVDAEDGFGTTLAVTDGQTSISAHTSDGVGPTNIAFSVVAKPSDGGDNPQQQGPSIEFFADSSIEGGTLAVNNGIFTLSKGGSVLGTFNVTLVDSANQETAYAGNEERIPLNDISSVKIVMTPAEGMKAKLITGGDTPVGALSEPVFNDAGNTYTYTAYPSQFGGEQQFLAVSVWFGESEDDMNQVDFTAVIWDGDQVENKSEHGSITVSSVVIGSTTYTYKGNGRFENNNTETDLIEWYGYNKTSINEEAGVRIMDAAFDDPNTEVYINFLFKPDYGYQVTGIGTNESTTSLASAGFSASETISTFRFKVIQHNNPHFAVAFTATEEIVKANAASISEGGVELAAGELDGGSAVLEVNEANITNQGDFEAAAEGYVVSEYLDISLYNVFYKGNAEDFWSTPVETLDSPAKITLKLEEGIDTDTVKIVHEKGDGEFELLDADYDPETQEITFSTSSFSNYAIAYEESGNETTEEKPETPSTSEGTTEEKGETPSTSEGTTEEKGETPSTSEGTTEESSKEEEPETPEAGKQTGWVQVGTKWYYLNADGTKKTGWVKDGTQWYYLNADGSMKTGWVKDESQWYYLSANGSMKTGWVKDGSQWYYLSANGSMKTGWVKDGSQWYYLSVNGSMKTGWVKDGSQWYYLNVNGTMKTGWMQENGKWYYLNGSGDMAQGWIKVASKWYYLGSSGDMITGWLKQNNIWYYLSGSGEMLSGWQQIKGKWYYFYTSGQMASNTKIGSHYVNANGEWVK